MLGHGDRDALRTERFVDELMAASDRGAGTPAGTRADADVDPAIRTAARVLRANLTRVHPSFRFEEALAERLAAAATGSEPGTLTPFPVAAERSAIIADRGTAVPDSARRAILPAAAFRRLPEAASHPSRPFIVGGVGVASAAISIGAVYVAWRHSRPSSGRMGRAIRAAHDRSPGSGRNRRSGATHGIFGVLS